MKRSVFRQTYGLGLEAETAAIVGAMATKPSGGWLRAANKMVRDLKAIGAWTRCDSIWVLAAETSQAALLDWKNPTGTALAVSGTPTFIPSKGYKGNGTDSTLTGPTNYSALTQFTQNDCHLAAFCPNADGDNLNEAGIAGATNSISLRIAAGGGVQYRLNTVTATIPTQFGDRGLTIVCRTGSTATSAFSQGAPLATGSQASSAVTAAAPTILSTVNAAFSTRVVSYFSVGASMDAVAAHYSNAVKDFMCSIGAFVR